MNLIKEDIEAIIPSLSWNDFTQQDDYFVATYLPKVDRFSNLYDRFIRLRSKYPSDYAAAIVSKLPEGATFVDYDHLSLQLRVTRA